MKLFTDPIIKKLRANSVAQANAQTPIDFKPVVKIFNPTGAGTWLLTEMDDDGTLFGLAHVYEIELGYSNRNEMEAMRIRGLGLERDLSFKADKTLSQYTTEARQLGHINA